MRHALIIFIGLLMLAAPVLAQDMQPAALRFYSHPTERYNILIPPGWTDESDAQGTQFADPTSGARLWALSIAGEDPQSALDAGLQRAFPGLDTDVLTLDTVNLITGQWSQAAVFTNQASAVVFAQVYQGRTFVIVYRTEDGALPLVVRTQALIDNSASADTAFALAFALLGLRSEPNEAARSADDAFERGFTVDGAPYTGWLRGVSASATDVIIQPGARVESAHTIIFTVLRDFFVTPDTGSYLGLGLAAVAVITAALIVSLIIRQRNLHADEAALHRLAGDAS